MRRPLLSLVAATALLLALAAARALDQHGLLGTEHAARPLPVQAGLRRAQPRLPRHRRRPGPDRRPGRRRPRHPCGRRSPSSRRALPTRTRSARSTQSRLRGRRHRPDLGSGCRRRGRDRGDRGDPPPARRPDPAGVRRARDDRARRRSDRGERRLLRHRRQLAPDRVRLRARPQLHPAHDRVPLDRDPRRRDRAQPALGRRRLRPARARLPEGRRRRPPRLPAGRHGRGVGAALPLLRPLRPLDGLPGVPAQPDQGALQRRPATPRARSPSASARPPG